jgi:hypothetical protein
MPFNCEVSDAKVIDPCIHTIRGRVCGVSDVVDGVQKGGDRSSTGADDMRRKAISLAFVLAFIGSTWGQAATVGKRAIFWRLGSVELAM